MSYIFIEIFVFVQRTWNQYLFQKRVHATNWKVRSSTLSCRGLNAQGTSVPFSDCWEDLSKFIFTCSILNYFHSSYLQL